MPDYVHDVWVSLMHSFSFAIIMHAGFDSVKERVEKDQGLKS